MLWADRFRRIATLADSDEWDARQNGFPHVTANLSLAIDSLRQQETNFWRNPESAARLLQAQNNKGVLDIFSLHSDTEIAFAIRAARK